jgi:short-subunit dehydrogenase
MPMTEPDDAARVILAGIEKGRLHIYVGGVARLANIAIRIAPRQAILFVRKQMESLMSTDESTPGASV